MACWLQLQDNLGVKAKTILFCVSREHSYRLHVAGLVVKFSGYTEIKAMFERGSEDPSKPLAPWKHMVRLPRIRCV